MLKHVSHHRSTSSMTRTSCSSLKIRGEPLPPKIIRTQDDSDLRYETTLAQEVLFSSPELLRKDLSSPESCTSDLGSPEIIKRCTKSGRSQSLQSSPVIRRKLGDVPEGYESTPFKQNFLDVPDTFRNLSSGQESDEDPHSSPEVSKKDLSSSRATTLPRRGVQRALDILAMKGQEAARKSFRNADTCSITSSTGSFSSYCPGKLTSRASSTSSLDDQTVTPVKVYLRFMRPDIEYKTLRLSTATTCRQLIVLLLAKFRLRHRDPNLFFVRMEITVRSPGDGVPTRRLLVLDDQARPAELQQCRPRGDARFSVGVRRGGLLRIHDSILMPGSQYKSLLVSYRTTSEELVQLLLNCYNSKESPRHYAVHEVIKCPYSDRQLRHDDYPLLIQSEWPRNNRQNYSFVLRRNANYALSLKARISWRRSLDHSSTDTESEHEDSITGKRKSRAPSLPITHTPSYKTSSSGNLLNDCLSGPPSRASNVSSLSSTSSLSPSMSRVSCDSGFSSPSSSSRSSTASAGSPSPPASPSLPTNSKSKVVESRLSEPFTSSINTSSVPSSSIAIPEISTKSLHSHQPVTVTVNKTVTVPSDSKSDTNTTSSATIKPKLKDKPDLSLTDLPSSSCILTIPLSPITVPMSPPPLSVLSSSVIESLSPTSSSPIVSGTVALTSSSPTPSSSRTKTKPRLSSVPPTSRVSLCTNPVHTTLFCSSDPPSSLCVPLEGTLIPPTSAPPSPSQSHPHPKPPSPSAPTSPCRNPQSPPPLQSTIITIPSSGPSVVSSNTLSASAHAGMRELSAALESLRTLTIRCPNYDNCFYI